MRETRTALKSARHKLLALDNVVGVGVGYKEVEGERTDEVAVVVFVKKKFGKKHLLRGQVVPQKVEGVNTDVIEVGEVRFLSRTDRIRPARPGVSIGHYAVTAGTFGALVRDTRTGEILILSNNHVLANASTGYDAKAKSGDPILQPGAYDGGAVDKDTIARLERFAPLRSTVASVDCPVASAALRAVNGLVRAVRPRYALRMEKKTGAANVVDAAVAKPLSRDLVTGEIMEIGPVEGVAEPQLGMKVKKMGRTSGYTEGTVKALDVTLNVDMGDKGVYLFSEQIMANLNSQPGDSGSLVLDHENRAVGLLFAGSDTITAFNNIFNVMSVLGVEML